MIKLNKDSTDEKESELIKDEFLRISRKYCDIFERLWVTNDWIKRYNLPKTHFTKAKSPNRIPNISDMNQ